jgi:hypothetical protein
MLRHVEFVFAFRWQQEPRRNETIDRERGTFNSGGFRDGALGARAVTLGCFFIGNVKRREANLEACKPLYLSARRFSRRD